MQSATPSHHRSSGEILRELRETVLDLDQAQLGRKLNLHPDHISRIENGRAGRRVKPKHLASIHQLKPPPGREAACARLLEELEAAVREEEAPIKASRRARREEAASAVLTPSPAPETVDATNVAVAQTTNAGSVSTQATNVAPAVIHEVVDSAPVVPVLPTANDIAAALVAMAPKPPDPDEVAKKVAAEVIAQQPKTPDLSEVVRQAVQETAQATVTATQRFEEARLSELRKMTRLAYVALAAPVLALAVLTVHALRESSPRTESATRDDAGPSRNLSSSPVSRDLAEDQDLPDEGRVTSGLDGGTQVTKLLKQALRMPQGALPGQMATPCPEGADEINGYCWKRWSFTPAQVKEGICDEAFYEPSEGWCRAHHAGYTPVRHRGQRNNAVEPQ